MENDDEDEDDSDFWQCLVPAMYLSHEQDISSAIGGCRLQWEQPLVLYLTELYGNGKAYFAISKVTLLFAIASLQNTNDGSRLQ